jgi:hypothetical protein
MNLTQPSPYALAILNGLQFKRAGEVYQGTVPGHVKAKRRAENKAARVSRRINRGQR